MTNAPSQPSLANGQLNRETFFPTFVYFRDFPDAATFNAEIKQHIYAWRDEDQEGIVRSNVAKVGSWHSTVDMHLRPAFEKLARRISESLEEVYADLEYDPDWQPQCDNMWANITPRHGYNRNHIHPNVLWSGVYYVQAPENSGRLFFTDPRAQAQVLTPRYDPNKPRPATGWSEVFYEPIEGRAIFFPAWLVHEVEPNMSEAEGPAADRISVSFNFFQQLRKDHAS